MGGKAFGVAQVIGNIDQPQRIQEAEGRFLAAVDVERNHGSAVAHLRHGEVMLRVVLESGIVDPGDFLPRAQEVDNGAGVFAMALNPDVQGLQPLQHDPGIERA